MKKLWNIIKELWTVIFTSAISEQQSQQHKAPKTGKTPRRRAISLKPTRYIIKPKSCKKYYFNTNGQFVNKLADGVDIVLVVMAINDHNAQRKFWTWKQTQPTL